MTNKAAIASVILLLASACGPQYAYDPREGLAGIYIIDPLTGGPGLLGDRVDFSRVVEGQTQSIDNFIACDGTYGNSGLVSGVAEGMMKVTTPFSRNSTFGIIQFGHSKYVGASDTRCHDVSKESYTYTVENYQLSICLVNYGAPCSIYQRAAF